MHIAAFPACPGVFLGAMRGLLLWVLLTGCAANGPQLQSPPLGQPADASEGVVSETKRLMNLALDRWLERHVRLQQISQRLRLAGVDVCKERLVPILGAAVADMAHVPLALRYPAYERFGPLEGLRVIDVFPNMAGARSDLMRGDIILRIDGRWAKHLTDLNRPLADRGPLSLEVERGGNRLELAVDREPGCGFPAEMLFSDEVNAVAARSRVFLSSSLVRELEDDALLAMVVGHELAHNILWHSYRDGSNVKLEIEADYLGIYLVSMADFPLVEDADLYITIIRDINRIAKRSRTHPAGAARMLAFRETMAEISDRRARGLPLQPLQ